MMLLLLSAEAWAEPPDGGSQTDAGRPAPRLGNHDEVCRFGARRGPKLQGKVARVCGAGLECCYACGVAGCDSICRTPKECALDAHRP